LELELSETELRTKKAFILAAFVKHPDLYRFNNNLSMFICLVTHKTEEDNKYQF
jgi:hypothetical protein